MCGQKIPQTQTNTHRPLFNCRSCPMLMHKCMLLLWSSFSFCFLSLLNSLKFFQFENSYKSCIFYRTFGQGRKLNKIEIEKEMNGETQENRQTKNYVLLFLSNRCCWCCCCCCKVMRPPPVIVVVSIIIVVM